MAEVRFNIDDNFLKGMQEKYGSTKTTDLMRDALTVFNWALSEKREGRQIVSTDADSTSNPVRLATPGLDNIKKVV